MFCGPFHVSSSRLSLVSTLLIVAAAVACGGDDSEPGSVAVSATTVAAQPAAASHTNGSVVDAANAFLSSLTDVQRGTALYAFDDPVRANWSNLPAGVARFDRNGVRIGDLDAAQTESMLFFLASALSVHGYETALGVLGADAYLAVAESEDRFGDDNYWLAIFGEPSNANAWGWQLGGHHLAINATVTDGRSYLSPTFVGVEPASYTVGASTMAPLDTHLQAGLALINVLDEDKRAAGTLSNRPEGIYTGAGQDGVIPPIEGSRAAGWSDAQRQLLLEAIFQWVGMLDSSSSRARLAEIQSELNDTYFAWHVGKSGSIYFRIQGPSLIVEFSTGGGPASDAGHYHTIYRNPANEYGRAVYRER